MDKSLLVKLTHKYLQGNATEEECQLLMKHYDLFELEPDVTTSMSEAEKHDLAAKLQSGILEDIENQEERLRPRRSNIKLWGIGIAAAASIFIAFMIILFIFNQQSTQPEHFTTEYNKTTTQRFLSLPDGSTIVLSAGSKVYYSSSFLQSDTREVNLEGQAYFDIKHNASKPFIIHTGKVSTTVLGTAFNIMAWPKAADVTVTVTRGKVKINDEETVLGIITPNQQIEYNMKDAAVLQKTVNAQASLSWRNEDLLFDNVTVGEATKLLETKYNVSVSLSEGINLTKRFTTLIAKEENLEKVLLSICEFYGATYKYDKNKGEVLIVK
jgi:ferric-dicitrate binding protein FerR (iron transport regulator)